MPSVIDYDRGEVVSESSATIARGYPASRSVETYAQVDRGLFRPATVPACPFPYLLRHEEL